MPHNAFMTVYPITGKQSPESFDTGSSCSHVSLHMGFCAQVALEVLAFTWTVSCSSWKETPQAK